MVKRKLISGVVSCLGLVFVFCMVTKKKKIYISLSHSMSKPGWYLGMEEKTLDSSIVSFLSLFCGLLRGEKNGFLSRMSKFGLYLVMGQ